MMKAFLLFILILCMHSGIKAQPQLTLIPDEIEFEDSFHRMENVLFINTGNEQLIIDSIYYNSDLYFVRFDSHWNFPFYLNPGDTVKMDCILSSYYVVNEEETRDTLYILDNSSGGLNSIKVKIDYFDDDHGDGIINGQILSGGSPVSGASVYFLFEGNYVIHKAVSNNFGFYSALLPPGEYYVAVEKDSFYTTFYDGHLDPFSAVPVEVLDDSIRTANFDLPPVENTGRSISGVIFDSLSITPLKKGMLVIRKGNHTPSKPSGSLIAQDGIYSAFIQPDGSYLIPNIADEDYYFLQAFSDYYVPAFFSTENSTPFWQAADSILVNGDLIDKNISLPRDSSVGGGIISGVVTSSNLRGNVITDVIVYAQSTENNLIYNYTLAKEDGSYKMSNLPYGKYRLFAQKIGLNDAHSPELTIDTSIVNISGVDITFVVTVINDQDVIENSYKLYQNYPNPFNPVTNIEIFLPAASDVRLEITNILGQSISILHNGMLSQGNHRFIFDANGLSSGTYFITFQNVEKTYTKKIQLLK